MMCENAPSEWLHVPEENIKRFQQSIRYKRADDKDAALEKFMEANEGRDLRDKGNVKAVTRNVAT